MPDCTDPPRNPIKWHVRVVALAVILILTAAVWAAKNGWV